MILGALGQARAGKDTLADYLVAKYGFVRIALADPIKRIAMDIYDMSEEQLWGNDKELPDLRYPMPTKGFLTPRVACQLIGTEVVRSLYPNTWIDMFQRTAQAVLLGTHFYTRIGGLQENKRVLRYFTKKAQGVVCPDVRFKNEVQSIRRIGGLVVRLRRDGKDGSVGVKGHASEEEQKSIPDSDLDSVMLVPEGIPNFHTAISQLMEKLPMRRRLKLVS